MKLKVPIPRKAIREGGRALNDSDRLFIEHYLKTGNATESYLAAGFNGSSAPTNALKMLKKKGIQDFLKAVKEKAVSKVAKRLEITVDKVLDDLESARTIALQSLPTPQCAAAIKASELQGKHIGMFRDDYADREQMPMIIINSGEGTQIAVVGREQGQVIPHAMHHTPMIPDDTEYLTDADLL